MSCSTLTVLVVLLLAARQAAALPDVTHRGPEAGPGVCRRLFQVKEQQKVMEKCELLHAQGAQLAWTLHPAAGPEEQTVLEIVFAGTAPSPAGWVGWGLNLGPSPSMVGTQAFIAFQASNGSCLLTYNVSEAIAMGAPLACSPVALQVRDMAVHIQSNSSYMVMWLSLVLPSINSSLLHHVWNRGSSVAHFQPGPHGGSSDDLSAFKTIDMASGLSSTSAAPPPASPRRLLKNRHGVLNVVGWGIILPCGVLVARYLRPLTDPAWFYIHTSLQVVGYAVGVSGWATGLKLGNDSMGIVYRKHRVIGIILFAVATLQVVGAILVRPKKQNKVRRAWNLYHYTLGATLLLLAILNIFYGFDILSPSRKWRRAYVWVLVALAIIAFFLEAYKCTQSVLHARTRSSKMQGAQMGGAHSLGTCQT